MEEPDFVSKYGAPLYMLEHGEEEIEEFAQEPGYTRAIGRQWRRTHCEAVLGYMRSIRTDYEILWQQTSAKAVRDAWLGTWLGNTEKQLKRLQRRLRVYVLVQKIAPPPRPGKHLGLITK